MAQKMKDIRLQIVHIRSDRQFKFPTAKKAFYIKCHATKDAHFFFLNAVLNK
jgi:hypothetical protein